jgi:hypothetical protein
MFVGSVYASMGGAIKDPPLDGRSSTNNDASSAYSSCYNLPTTGLADDAEIRLNVVRFLAQKVVPFLSEMSSTTGLTPPAHVVRKLSVVFSFPELFHAEDWRNNDDREKVKVSELQQECFYQNIEDLTH